jgi:transcriptional regulator with XRE-family HTH domain
MRDAYLSGQTRTKLTNQIRAIRNQRGWSQGEFAQILGKPQSNVSRLENREYGNFTLNTLFELASAFDVGLVVEFVPYDDFLRRTHDLNPSRLQVRKFSRSALVPLCRDEVATVQVQTTGTINAITPIPVGILAHTGTLGGQLIPLGWHEIGMSTLSRTSGSRVDAAQSWTTGGTPIHQGNSTASSLPTENMQTGTNQPSLQENMSAEAAE